MAAAIAVLVRIVPAVCTSPSCGTRSRATTPSFSPSSLSSPTSVSQATLADHHGRGDLRLPWSTGRVRGRPGGSGGPGEKDVASMRGADAGASSRPLSSVSAQGDGTSVGRLPSGSTRGRTAVRRRPVMQRNLQRPCVLRDRPLVGLVVVGALSMLVLAGCGGGGGTAAPRSRSPRPGSRRRRRLSRTPRPTSQTSRRSSAAPARRTSLQWTVTATC